MKTSDFYYDLPKELIAQTPAEPRDSSRLLVCDRENGGLTHAVFGDILSYLRPGDVLIANNTRVLPARLFGRARAGGGNIEFLLHKRLSLTEWEVLVKPGKRAREGAELDFPAGISSRILAVNPDGTRIASFTFPGTFEDALLNAGEMPLPPYIKEKLTDRERYQTVYSKESGSSAAPTAGLHFTPQLIAKIKDKGVIWREVLLHVGLGTFRPVKEESVENHLMHSERYELTKETADAINLAKKEGRRVIAVGTTSVRVLETCAEMGDDGEYCVRHNTGETAIFIYPPYKFKVVDALITNFHLPESTLLMLISAFMGRENALNAYKLAVKEKYRFFSFGDAMLIIGAKKLACKEFFATT